MHFDAFLSFQKWVICRSLSPPERAQQREHGGCSSGVEPRIVIPVVAGSNPVSHPTFTKSFLMRSQIDCDLFYFITCFCLWRH